MDRFQDKRVWLGGGVVAALLIVARLVHVHRPGARVDRVTCNAQAAATAQPKHLLQPKLKALQVKSTQLDKYTSSLKQALLSLPFDSGLPAFTRQLSAQAGASGVDREQRRRRWRRPPVLAAAPVATRLGNSTRSSPTSSTGVAAPRSATVAGGLFSVQVTVQSDGTLAHQLAFLNAVRTAGPGAPW